MTNRFNTALLVLLAVVLSGCGLFGDGDEAATAFAEPVEVVPPSVRIEFEDRWFDIDTSQVQLNSTGAPTSATRTLLGDTVDNLGADLTPPQNAGVVYDGSQFVIEASVPGTEPDIDALAALIEPVTTEDTSLTLPLQEVAAEVTDRQAQRFADELNQRLGDGLDVAIGGRRDVLSASVVGPATTISRGPDGWEVAVDFDEIDAPLKRLFPDVETDGGQASFRVVPGETDDDPNQVEVVPGAPSVVCCDEASAVQIADVLSTGRRPINLLLGTQSGPRGTEWAEGLGITELVASFTTRYTPGQSRNINIQRIAELTQGVIIEPGETFSVNEFVGQRTTANGFVPAGTIVNGHLVDSVGGGISQYATTLFNASFFAGLEFEDYQSHSIYFSRYPYGREATISWPAPALKIHNPTPYGILVWPTTTNSGITVELFSTKWVNVEQTGQSERPLDAACTRVTTQRTRTFLDGDVDVDSVIATYRREGIACDGTETVDPDAPTTTTTTIDPDAPTTTVDPNAPTTTVDPNAPTTTVDPNAPTTTVDPNAPTTTVDPNAPTTTTTVDPDTPTTTTVAEPAPTTTTVAPDATTTTTVAPAPDTTIVAPEATAAPADDA